MAETNLIQRLQEAKEMTPELFWEVFDWVVTWDDEDRQAHIDDCVEAGAWESAALLLVDRSKWRVSLEDWSCEGGSGDLGGARLERAIPILPPLRIPENGYIWARTVPGAILSCCVKAHEATS